MLLFDASGTDIERDWEPVRSAGATWTGPCLRQVREYELPTAAGKAGDPRSADFARRYGLDPGQPVQWEAKVLAPAELQCPVLAAVAPYIEQAALRDRIAEEERQGTARCG